MKKYLLLVILFIGILVIIFYFKKQGFPDELNSKNTFPGKNNNLSISGNQNISIKLSNFDKEIIKIATLKNNPDLCDNTKYVDYCKNIVNQENEKLVALDCSGLIYLKEKCYNQLYYKNLQCDKISDVLLKRQCLQQKELKQAIENHDISYCYKLPRIKQKECFEMIEGK